jgi:hypothetical protein
MEWSPYGIEIDKLSQNDTKKNPVRQWRQREQSP